MKSSLSGAKTMRGIGIILITVVFFALNDTFSKYLSRFYPIPELLWVRYAIHVLLMLALFAPRMGWKLVKTNRPVLQVLRALLLIAVTVLVMNSLLYLPIAEVTAINFLTPLLVTALSVPLLGEKVMRRDWIAVLFGFAGVLVIVRPGGGLLQLAVLLPLSAAVCYSLYQIMTRRFSGSEDPVTTHFITGLVGVTVMMFAWGEDWVLPSLSHAGLMLCMGLVGSVGHFLLIKAFELARPATLAPFTYTQLLWGTLLGYLVFNELPDMGSAVGMLVIAGSGLYVAYRHARPARKLGQERS